MSSSGPPRVLITIPISHYCEKARWALDRTGVRYREQAHLQLIHRLAARRAGGGRTVPVLVCGERVLAESADIVDEADANAPQGQRLYPEDPGAAAEVRALERYFDADLGPHGRRWMYNEMRGRRDLAVAYGCTGVPTWERRVLPLAFPVATRMIDRVLDITADTAAQSEAQVAGGLRRGRRAAQRRPAISLRRSVHRRRSDVLRAGGICTDAARVRGASAAAWGATGGDGGGRAGVSRAPRGRARARHVPRRAALRHPRSIARR